MRRGNCQEDSTFFTHDNPDKIIDKLLYMTEIVDLAHEKVVNF